MKDSIMLDVQKLNDLSNSIETGKEFRSLDEHKADIKKKNLSYDDLLNYAASFQSWCEVIEYENDGLEKLAEGYRLLLEASQKAINQQASIYGNVSELSELEVKIVEKAAFLKGAIHGKNSQKKIQGNLGAQARNAKFDPLRSLACELVRGKKWKSRRNAALTIKPQILDRARKLSIPLSEQQAEDSITGWLKNAGLPANM